MSLDIGSGISSPIRAVIYAAEEGHVLLEDRENPRDCRKQEAGKIAIIDGEAMKKDGDHD
jgi:hypothetical protein